MPHEGTWKLLSVQGVLDYKQPHFKNNGSLYLKVSTVLKIHFSVICNIQKLLCTLHVCYDFSARFEIVTAGLQKTQAFLEIVPRRFEVSWCLPIHIQAVQESINDPSKSREVFTQRRSATRRNTRTLRSDSSKMFVHTDNVTQEQVLTTSSRHVCRINKDLSWGGLSFGLARKLGFRESS